MVRYDEVLCHKYGCRNFGTKFCGACGESCYCSSECQAGDWKIHKMLCGDRLPIAQLPADEVKSFMDKINKHVNILSTERKGSACISVIKKFLTFLEHQFGAKVPGKYHRLRHDGGQVDDLPIITLRLDLAQFYYWFSDLDKAIACAVEGREMLETRRIEGVESMFKHIYRAESILHQIYKFKNEMIKAQHHAELALSFARQHRGEDHITTLYEALKEFAAILKVRNFHDEAQEFTEEAYILVSEAYGPEHPDVQDASIELIENLIGSGKLSQADDYARINYETLINGCNPDSDASATSMRQLANIWTRKPLDPTEDPEIGDEAEQLAKKAYEIVSRTHNNISPKTSVFLDAVIDVAVKKGQLTGETRLNLEIVLRSYLKFFGSLGIVTYGALSRLAKFYLDAFPKRCVEYKIGSALVDLAYLIRDLINCLEGVDDKDAKLAEPDALFTEIIHDFLKMGCTKKMLELITAAVVKYQKVVDRYTIKYFKDTV